MSITAYCQLACSLPYLSKPEARRSNQDESKVISLPVSLATVSLSCSPELKQWLSLSVYQVCVTFELMSHNCISHVTFPKLKVSLVKYAGMVAISETHHLAKAIT